MASTRKFSIEAIFKAIDKMSNPLKGINKNTSKFSRALRTDFAKAQRSVNNFTKSIKRNLGNNLKKAVAVGGIAIASLGAMFVTEASKIEDVTAAFTPLLGSVEKANQLVDMLNQTAATTPFQLENIAESATQLLPAMNGDLEATVKTFRMLGDTAGGNAEKLNRISAVYSRVLLKNKLETGDLNILTERGIPIYQELSKSMGVSVTEMAKMASQGKITGADLTKAFQNMTSEGGIFFNGMEIASQTLTGKFSTLKDNIALTAATIGTTLLPVLKPLIDRGIEIAGKMREWATANQDLISERLNTFLVTFTNTVKGIISVVSTMVNIIKPLAPFIIGIATAFGVYNAVMKLAAIATVALNAAMNANPVSLIIIGVGLLIGGLILLVKNIDIVKNAMVTAFKFIGKTLLTFLVTPLNLMLEYLQTVLKVVSKIPGLSNIVSPAIDTLQDFQDKINQNTFFNNENATPVSAQERANNNTASTSGELLIRDETGRAEMTKNPNGGSFQVKLSPSGGL